MEAVPLPLYPPVPDGPAVVVELDAGWLKSAAGFSPNELLVFWSPNTGLLVLGVVAGLYAHVAL